MRRIEENMLSAVRNGRNFRNGNTEVKVTKEDGEQITRVLLHGNCIFEQVQNISGLYEKYFNLCGWNTPTTRSRLNALGVNVRQKNYEAVYNGQPISLCQWYTVY